MHRHWTLYGTSVFWRWPDHKIAKHTKYTSCSSFFILIHNDSLYLFDCSACVNLYYFFSGCGFHVYLHFLGFVLASFVSHLVSYQSCNFSRFDSLNKRKTWVQVIPLRHNAKRKSRNFLESSGNKSTKPEGHNPSQNHIISFSVVKLMMKYTLLQNKGGGGAPPPHNFRRTKLTPTNYISLERDLSKSPIQFRYRQNILISRLYEQFSRNAPKKISNFKNMYLTLKHVIWRFRICNYFCEISKFRDFMNTLRNFAKSVLLIFPRNLNISRNNLY